MKIRLSFTIFILLLIYIMDSSAFTMLTHASLRAHWKLDDGTGTIAADDSGNGHIGTLINGPVWTTGQVDGALEFDGLNDQVLVDPVPLAMNTWNAISVGAWIKNDIGSGAGTDDIISYWNYPSSRSWVLTHHGNNQYFWQIQGKGYVMGGTVSSDWTHVVGTYDGSTMRLYVNGAEVVATAGFSGNLPLSTADIIIGGQEDGSNVFDGIIDEVRIYDHALTAQEVQDLYNGTTPPPDSTPPTRPENLTAISIDFTSIELSWTASDDPESGVDHYNVYRDGVNISAPTSTSYTDNNLLPGTTYTYEVSAVNGQTLESIKSDSLDVTTLADTFPPEILSVAAQETSVTVTFDEELDAVTATNVNNYSITNGINIFDAVLEADDKTVTLATSSHSEGINYDLTVSAVEDISGNPMALTTVSYTATLLDPFLQAYWKFDDGSGNNASDSSGNGNDGTLLSGPVWSTGGLNGALIFDGQNDRVVVDSTPFAMDTWSAISVGAWIKNDIGAGAGTDDIISHWNYPSSRSWVLTHHGNNQYFWEIQGKGAISGGTVGTDWTHVMGTFDGSTMRLYVNGLEVSTLAGLSGNLSFSTADIIIGGQADGSNFFDGIIDEVRIFNRVLSAQEIQDIIDEFDPGQMNIPPTVSASATPEVGLVPLQVQFSAIAQDSDGTIISYLWLFGDGQSSTQQNPLHTYNDTGNFTAQVTVTDDQDATAVDFVTIEVRSGATGPAVIDVWYDLDQNFGNIGIAQVWANILGNVFDPDGIASLRYTLNGGDPIDLSIGPDNRRLVMDGDYNIDIDMGDLQSGSNSVEITATDVLGDDTTETVSIQYTDNLIWPLPYTIDWSTVTDIQDAVQVVDGLWTVTPQGIRIVEIGYDRVLAVGDLAWTDYEVTVPITVHDYDSGPLPPFSVSAGFGITLRWTGHTNSPVFCSQPRCGWLPSGAGAWYDIGSGGPLKLDGVQDPGVTINIGNTYIWKYRVETIQGVGPLYSLKVWQQGQAEPTGWNLQKQRNQSDELNGSLIIILHHVDASIGNMTIIPVGTSVPDTTPPTVEFVRTVSQTEVLVAFSEPVDPSSATDIANYSIDNGILISGAVLDIDEQNVTLTTSPHSENITYSIQVSGVGDQESPPNVMTVTVQQYVFSLVQPVAQYLFESVSGATTPDSSGNGFDATLENGPLWLNDPERGNIIELDGINDRLTVDSAPLSMNTWTQMTVAAWVRNDTGSGAGTNDIVSWWRWTGYPCSDCSFVLTHHGNDQYFFELGGTSISGGSVSTAWTFVVATYDGSMIRLSVNGIEVASAPYAAGIPSSTADLIFGSQADSSNYFDGRIDNVEIYDIALTAAEILSIYNNSQ